MNHRKKRDFKKEGLTTEYFIEHEMAQYAMMGFDEESGHSECHKGGMNSVSTSQGDLAGVTDGEAEVQQQQSSGNL